MNVFDIFYLCLLVFFFWRGWQNGIFKSLIAPGCLLFWIVLGVIHYDLNENVLSSIIFVFIGTFFSALIIHFLLFMGKISVEKKHRGYIFGPSRIAGAIINTTWNGFLTGLLVVFISLAPNHILGLDPVQRNISHSILFNKICVRAIDPFPTVKNIYLTISVFKDYSSLERYRETPQYQKVFSHPKIQSLIENKELMSAFYSKDGIKLLGDPRIRDLLKDESLMRKISDLAAMIYKEKARTAQNR